MSELPPGCRILGRYALFDEIAAGGMATVHLGRLLGPVGFTRTVAVKRLHAQYARDEEFVEMFLDEARLAGRIQHPNVVSTVDVFPADGELFLVMEYIRGETLSWLARQSNRRGMRIPIDVATSAVAGALYGLHAAHEAVSEQGEALDIVHRDVSPHNIMLGVDGVPRVLDFGVAKAASRLQSTRGGQLKGKLSYMAPEQLHGKAERRTDVYAAAVVLWELLVGKRLFDGENEAALMMELLKGCQTPPSKLNPNVPPALDDVVMRGLALEPEQRFSTAREMAIALERAIRPATPRELGEWLTEMSGDRLQKRLRRVAEIESMSAVLVPPSAASGGDSLAGSPALGAHDAAAYVMQSGAWNATSPSSSNAQGWVDSATTASTNTATAATYVSDTGVGRPRPREGRRTLLIGVAATAAIASILGCAALLLMPSRGSAPAAATPTSTSPPVIPATTASDTTAPVASASAPTPSASATTPVASASATTATTPPAIADPPRAKPGARTVPDKKPRAGGCDPPYVVDSAGVKRFKPECL